MIIAIDETGDFNPNSKFASFFIAVLLDQTANGIQVKKEQYNKWLKTIPKEKYNKHGEIKGSDLNDGELLNFVEMVFNVDPIVRHEVVYFFPSENPENLMKIFKEIEVESILKTAKLYRANGKIEMEQQYKKMAIWHKNAKKMHYQHYFKLVLLRSLINKAFNTSVGVSILFEMLGNDKESINLLNLKFKIDQDFVRGKEATNYWKETLRNSFISYTLKNPIPLLDSWKEDSHPFVEKYKGNIEGILNFKDLMQNNCDFLESHDNFEIQLADILGIIVNRYHNRNKAVNAFKALYTILKKQKFTKVLLSETPNFDSNPIIME
jgi:hypothetical protein